LKPRFQQLLGGQPTDRGALVEKFRPALQMEGDPKRGAATFGKLCLQCHVIEGRGQQVGPDLSGIAARPKEALLVDIIDPSKDVSADFLAYTVTEPSGESLVGLIVSENENGVTLRRAALPDDLIPRERIKKLQASGKSLMPDGLEAGMSLQDFADLLKFLSAPKKDLLPE
jgi:putative heme-binding domain-containing protein